MHKLFFVLMLSVVLSSCYSYKIYPKEYRSFTYSGEKEVAYVVNPGLKKENAILKQSGIFTFTDDSMNTSCVRIKLLPLKKNFSCGEPILGALITLGQVPVYFLDRYHFQFEEISKSGTTAKDFELHVAQRNWFWDLFVFNKKFNQKAGKTLLASYYSKEAVASVHGSSK